MPLRPETGQADFEARFEALAARVGHAGAIFLGRYTPEAVGDDVAGPNHGLPTAATLARAEGLDAHALSLMIRLDAGLDGGGAP